MRVAVNGKFTSQRITGVQRVAHELMRAVHLNGATTDEVKVVAPRNATESGTSLGTQRLSTWFTGNLWEQISLPMATRGVTLISLCNNGPLLKSRQIVMVHDMAVYDVPQAFSKTFQMYYRLKFSTMVKNVPIILTISSFSKSRICHHLDVDESRVRVVLPGADHFDHVVSDHSIVDRLRLTDATYCVIVGSLDPRKNLRRVLQAIERLGYLKNVRFVIVGGANSRIFSSSQQMQKLDSVQIVRTGYVSDNELKALYQNAACLAFPSLYEGFGLPPLEAMYCGCPVIASSHPALSEACGSAALYCDARAVDDIAAKIALMMGDATLRQSYRIKGLRHAQKYRWDRAARELLKILKGDPYESHSMTTIQPSG
jgi:glycosyltransferase involved in cell wall biosynthesis